MQALTAQNEQLSVEQAAERRKSKEEALQWHREKVAQETETGFSYSDDFL